MGFQWKPIETMESFFGELVFFKLYHKTEIKFDVRILYKIT